MAVDPKVLHEQLVVTLKHHDEAELREFLAESIPADVAEVLELIDEVDRSRLIFALSSRAAAEVVVLLDERVREEVVDDISGDRLAEMVTEMPPDDAADVIAELPAAESDQLLEKLSDEQSEQIEELLKYDENTAGGLMNPNVLNVPETHTVRHAINYLQEADIDSEVFQIYTTQQNGRLSGVVSPQKLLISPPEKILSQIMESPPVSVTVEEDQEDVLHLFLKYDLTSLPVTNDGGTLVGHITVDDVMDVAAEEADEDIYHMAGTDAAELETSSIFRASFIRLIWLLPSFLFMAGTATVIILSKTHFDWRVHLALLAFVPMIGALAGCCSVQTSTIITRGLATGELAASKIRLAFARESRIALVMAPCCTVIAWILAQIEMPLLMSPTEIDELPVSVFRIANAVGLGMLAGITVASLLGISMPFVFRRLGIDPAIAAGPVVTAANDVLCVSLYLSLAYWVVSL